MVSLMNSNHQRISLELSNICTILPYSSIFLICINGRERNASYRYYSTEIRTQREVEAIKNILRENTHIDMLVILIYRWEKYKMVGIKGEHVMVKIY